MRSAHIAATAFAIGSAAAGSWWPPFARQGHDTNDYCPPCGIGPVRSDRRCVQCHGDVCVTTTETMHDTTTLTCQPPAQTTTVAITLPCSNGQESQACLTTSVVVAQPAPCETEAPEDTAPCTTTHTPSSGCACFATATAEPALQGMAAANADDACDTEPYGATGGQQPSAEAANNVNRTPYGAAGGRQAGGEQGSAWGAPVSSVGATTCSTVCESSAAYSTSAACPTGETDSTSAQWTFTSTGEWSGTTTGVWMPSVGTEEPVWSSTEASATATSAPSVSPCMYNLTQPAYANVSEIFTLRSDGLQAAEAAAARRFCDAVGGGVYCYSPLACQTTADTPEAQPNADAPCLPTVMISCPDAVFMACGQWDVCVQRDLRVAAQCVALADAVGPELAPFNPTPAVRVRDQRPVLMLTSVVTSTLSPTSTGASGGANMSESYTSVSNMSGAYTNTAYTNSAYSDTAYTNTAYMNSANVTTYTTTSAWVPTYCGGPNPPLLQAWMHSLSAIAATLESGGPMTPVSESYVTGTTMPTSQPTASAVCTVY